MSQIGAADSIWTGYLKVAVVWEESILDGGFHYQHLGTDIVKVNANDHGVSQLVADRKKNAEFGVSVASWTTSVNFLDQTKQSSIRIDHIYFDGQIPIERHHFCLRIMKWER